MDGKRLKEIFTECSDEFLEPMTFKDLKKGNKYISMPWPGDNKGDGGFKGEHYLFQKINPIVEDPNKHPVICTYNAIRIKDGSLTYFSDNSLVTKVE